MATEIGIGRYCGIGDAIAIAGHAALVAGVWRVQGANCRLALSEHFQGGIEESHSNKWANVIAIFLSWRCTGTTLFAGDEGGGPSL